MACSLDFAVVENWKCGRLDLPIAVLPVIIAVDSDVILTTNPWAGRPLSRKVTVGHPPLLVWLPSRDRKLLSTFRIHAS